MGGHKILNEKFWLIIANLTYWILYLLKPILISALIGQCNRSVRVVPM